MDRRSFLATAIGVPMIGAIDHSVQQGKNKGDAAKPSIYTHHIPYGIVDRDHVLSIFTQDYGHTLEYNKNLNKFVKAPYQRQDLRCILTLISKDYHGTPTCEITHRLMAQPDPCFDIAEYFRGVSDNFDTIVTSIKNMGVDSPKYIIILNGLLFQLESITYGTCS